MKNPAKPSRLGHQFLSILLGIAIGFVAGYLSFEQMSDRQPARRIAGDVPSGVPEAAAPPQAPAADQGNAAQVMERVMGLRSRLEADPNDAPALLELANLNFTIQRWDRTAELYNRYLELQPDSVDVMTDLGICYREMGEVDKAMDLFQRIRRLDPGHWQSRYNEVIMLIDLESYDEAKQAIDELVAIVPDNEQVAQLAAFVEQRLQEAG